MSSDFDSQSALIDELMINADRKLRTDSRSSAIDLYHTFPHALRTSTQLAELIICQLATRPTMKPNDRRELMTLATEQMTETEAQCFFSQLYSELARRGPVGLEYFDHFDCVSSGTLRARSDPVALGSVIAGRYQLVQRLGAGQFGVVFIGQCVDSGKRVAIKLPTIGSGAMGAAMVETEYNIAQRFRGIAGVVQPICIGECTDGTPFFVMELARGIALGTLVRQRRLSTEEAVKVVAAIADTVSEFQLRQIYHRDLKPDNIIVDDDLKPTIIDYGFAMSQQTQFEVWNKSAGTRAYMAPELLVRRTHDTDGRGDNWSLGIILLELLTGDLPVTAESLAILESEPAYLYTELQRQPPDIPKSLVTISQRCVADMPLRYYFAADIAADLRSALEDLTDPIRGVEMVRPSGEKERRLCEWQLALLTVNIQAMLYGVALVFDLRGSSVNATQPPSDDERRYQGVRAMNLAIGRFYDLHLYCIYHRLPDYEMSDFRLVPDIRPTLYDYPNWTEEMRAMVEFCIQGYLAIVRQNHSVIDRWFAHPVDGASRLVNFVVLIGEYLLGNHRSLPDFPAMFTSAADFAGLPVDRAQLFCNSILENGEDNRHLELAYVRLVRTMETFLAYGC